jgi:hypothetical protein
MKLLKYFRLFHSFFNLFLIFVIFKFFILLCCLFSLPPGLFYALKYISDVSYYGHKTDSFF